MIFWITFIKEYTNPVLVNKIKIQYLILVFLTACTSHIVLISTLGSVSFLIVLSIVQQYLQKKTIPEIIESFKKIIVNYYLYIIAFFVGGGVYLASISFQYALKSKRWAWI